MWADGARVYLGSHIELPQTPARSLLVSGSVDGQLQRLFNVLVLEGVLHRSVTASKRSEIQPDGAGLHATSTEAREELHSSHTPKLIQPRLQASLLPHEQFDQLGAEMIDIAGGGRIERVRDEAAAVAH